MSSIPSVSSAAAPRHAAPVARPVNADGDHDGSRKAAPAATSVPPPKLAQSGWVGRNLNTVA